MKKSLLVVLVGLMLFAEGFFFIVPVKSAPAVPSTTTTTTASQPLVPFTGSVVSVSRPLSMKQMGLDKGTNKIRFTQTSIQFFRSSGGNITIHFPSVGASLTTQALKNSTHIAYHFTGTFMGHAVDMFVYFRNGTNPYDRKIIITGTISGLVGTIPLSISLDNVQGLAVSNCDTNNTPKVCTVVFFGSMGFSWIDIPGATYNNATRILSFSVGASFFFDPLALDGSGVGSSGSGCSFTLSLTTTSINDIIIVFTVCDKILPIGTPIRPSRPRITDTAGLTWIRRGTDVNSSTGATPVVWIMDEFYAISANALSSDTITVTQGSSLADDGSATAFGISGANTGSPFDSHSGIPIDATSASTCTQNISTNNANDMIIGACVWANGSGSGYTQIRQHNEGNFYNWNSEYQIVSSVQTNLPITFSNGNANFGTIGDAIQQAVVTDIQPIKTTTSPVGAPNPTMSISGCGVSNSTFTGNGNTHTYSGVTINCTITVTVPTDATNTRYRLKEGSVAVGVTTWSIVTCASGTCALASNTTYYQLRNLKQATPLSPTLWDMAYTINVKGTVLGTASTVCGTIATTAGGGAASTQIWCDYNLLETMDSPITGSSTWTAFGPNTFTHTTGGNTDNVNYTFSSQQAIPVDTSSETIGIVALTAVILMTVMLGVKRRRR